MKVNKIEYNTYKVYYIKGSVIPRLIAYAVTWEKAVEIRDANKGSIIAPVID
jgi:hypothetical protein